MMWLVGITKGIKTCRTYLLHSCSYLFFTECMTLSELMFILAYAIDKDRLFIQVKATISIISLHRPTDRTDTERS